MNECHRNAPIPFYLAEPFLSKVTLRSLLGQIGQTVAGPANAVARRKMLADSPEWKVPVISRKHVLEMLYDEEAYKIIGHLTNPTKRSSCDCVGRKRTIFQWRSVFIMSCV